MGNNEFDIGAFAKRPDAVAAAVPAEELFGLLKRSLTLPARWLALVTREAGEMKIRGPGGPLEGEGVQEVMFVRQDSSELRFSFGGVPSADGYQCQVTTVLDVHVVPDKSELAAFRKTVVGSRREVTAEALTQHLHWQVRRAVSTYVGTSPAASLVEGKKRETFGPILRDCLADICFASGMAIERCGALQVISPGWQSVREEQETIQAEGRKHAAREQLREALAAAQHKHIQHVSQMLEQLRDLSDRNPDVTLGELIRTFSEQERGELYEALWSSETAQGRTQWVVIAAGKELLCFEPGAWKEPARRMTLAEAGALRSIRTVREGDVVWLLVGAARGVHMLNMTHEGPARTYGFDVEPDRVLHGGVNAATITGRHLLATHSEVGLLRWDLEAAGPAERLIVDLTAGARAVRGVQRFDRDVWLSVDDGVLRFQNGILEGGRAVIYTGSAGAVTALCASTRGIFAGNVRGDVLRWSPSEPKSPEILHRGAGRPAETVLVRTGGGVDRLLFADIGPALHVLVLGDRFSCGYDGGGYSVRRVEMADDLFVGLNDGRDRVLSWLPHQPSQPAAVLSLAQRIGQRVQDICLVPAG